MLAKAYKTRPSVAPMRQDQFLQVIDRDEAERRFQAVVPHTPTTAEVVPLAAAWGRVLAEDVFAALDVPSFDRSNVDGFAVRSEDTRGASEERPQRLRLLPESIATGIVPQNNVGPGDAMAIATGGMLPRGADAVVMVEHTDLESDALLVRRAVAAGGNISFAGTDIAAGELVLCRGQQLTSRETGVLAALGREQVAVYRRPKVAVISTGDEIIPPGATMQPGLVFDSNARILADAVRELGGEPVEFGVVRDDLAALQSRFVQALAECDVVLLSGGTSKGAGDLSYRVVRELTDPGIVAHGVALKPGKPICLAATQGKPVVVLPGFPTSAVFTFHEFVAPVIRRMAGLPIENRETIAARLAVKINSEIGRTEYVLVSLVHADDGALAAFPMGKGSGSVTAFSKADGFITIERQVEIVEAETIVPVQLLGRGLRPAELVIIGSHCMGLDYLLSELEAAGVHTKFLAVGSTAGLDAVKRGQCDLAGMHLFDPATGKYNEPFLTPELELIPGYGRLQGIVFRPGDARFEGKPAVAAVEAVRNDERCHLINRNAGSGTRVLIDRLLGEAKPPGYALQAKSHNAVAAAIAQGRADWGVAIQSAAKRLGLGFLPLQAEQYDFVVRKSRRAAPAVQQFVELLQQPQTHARLAELQLVRGRN